MKNLKELSPEIQQLLISCYEIGYWDRDAKLALFNNLVTNEEPILYLEAVLEAEKQEEMDLDLIDSVS